MATVDRDRPLDPVGSIKVKIGVLVALSIVAAALVLQVGTRSGVPAWITLPVTIAAALGVTQWLGHGMTAPLREMTAAAGRMARGDYDVRVTATSADEVGQLGRAFNTMAHDLASADQQQRQLVATVSHELRTPLAGQRALLENLVDGVITPDDATLQAALTQSERLSDLVQDLLEVSRVDGGAVRLELAPVRLAELLEGAVEEARVGGRPVQYAVTVSPPDLEVQADVARLHQVVANLLDNASRHSPAEGQVSLAATVLPGAERWALEVSDQGPGLSPERAEQLLARFGTGASAGGGTGLGLAIASWVCRLHGGTLTVADPDPGTSGARLRAELPMTPTTAPQEGNTMTTTTPTPEVPGRVDAAAADTAAPTTAAPSVVASMFGGLWPERTELQTAPTALLGSLLVGLLAAIILPERLIGLGTFLVLVAAGGLILWKSVHRSRTFTLIAAALCLGLGLLVVLRAAEWLSVLAILTACVLVPIALTDARRPAAMLSSGAAWVLSGIRGFPLLGRTLTATSRHQVLWPTLRTTAVSLVLLVIFVGLFASGDALFGSWVSDLLPTVEVADSVVLRAFTWFLVGGIVLAGCYLALNPPRVEAVAMGEPRPVSRPWEWQVPVGVVITVFAAFLVAQATAMWGGHDYLQETTGLTYAEYVHQGFGQLVTATLLTLVTIAVTVRKAPRSTAGDQRIFRILLGTLCLLTLVVVGSALYRMSLYQEAYGFTVLRLIVGAFELWLGLLVVLVMIAGTRLRAAWLPRAAVLSGAAFLLVIGMMNPEAWVAQRNIDRFDETGRLDLAYLSSLSEDAAPTIADGLPEKWAQCVLDPVDSSADDLLEWNLGRVRAQSVTVSDPGTIGQPGCPAEIGG